MPRILITSGPTRQYLDPVRYLSNASSGRMGAALADEVLRSGHQAVVVAGPAPAPYPAGADVRHVVSTEDMLAECRQVFPECDGLIACAAPCDYRPRQVHADKLVKSGDHRLLELVETPDIVATLSHQRAPHQWIVAFALETRDAHLRARAKLERKNCDLIVVNGPQAIDAQHTKVEVMARSGQIVAAFEGHKTSVARQLLGVFQQRLMPTADDRRADD